MRALEMEKEGMGDRGKRAGVGDGGKSAEEVEKKKWRKESGGDGRNRERWRRRWRKESRGDGGKRAEEMEESKWKRWKNRV
ncbi:hypothetical protein Pmani_025683 [Petrolisthes manimaculis]|uniref:Uncharacterized protein n=1 Tax=Petrolisthes manimaculis TaxID=1843537 RepID=A0AAE1P7L1_9EUCA|nr:hypothetical protein Pmani_025683 [Petrolisthes manimaculis]